MTQVTITHSDGTIETYETSCPLDVYMLICEEHFMDPSEFPSDDC